MKKIKKLLKKKPVAIFLVVVLLLVFGWFVVTMVQNINEPSGNKVLIKTSMGDITVELNPDLAPVTVENFLAYVDSGYYDNLVFHRVIEGFMIQGGGFEKTGAQKETNKPIVLESNNGLHNNRYTIAMARTVVPNSATSQFFINTRDNTPLDYSSSVNPGYAVFGIVVKGTDVVDKIEKVNTITKYGNADWPAEDAIIYSIDRV